MSDKKFFAFLAAMALLALAVFGGGCGGGSGGSSSDGGDPNGPENYRSEIAERLVSQDNVLGLAAFVKDSSMTAKKGDVLLYYPDNGEDITAHPDYLSRLNDALNDGAALAFVNITAEEIDKFADALSLDIPPYLTDDATDEEKRTLKDFYAVAARINDDYTESNHEEPVDFYEYTGLDLFDKTTTSMDIYYYDENGNAVKFDPDSATDGTAEGTLVDSGDVYDWTANPYSRVNATVEDFNAWVNGLSGLKSISEDKAAFSVARVAAAGATPTKKGVSLRFDYHWEPREFQSAGKT